MAYKVEFTGESLNNAVTIVAVNFGKWNDAVTAINTHKDDNTIHVTSDEKNTWNNKQDVLVSGTNIKTVNGNSLLGSGDITISSSGSGSVDLNDIDNNSISTNRINLKYKKSTFLDNGIYLDPAEGSYKTLNLNIDDGINIQNLDWDKYNYDTILDIKDDYIKLSDSGDTIDNVDQGNNDLNITARDIELYNKDKLKNRFSECFSPLVPVNYTYIDKDSIYTSTSTTYYRLGGLGMKYDYEPTDKNYDIEHFEVRIDDGCNFNLYYDSGPQQCSISGDYSIINLFDSEGGLYNTDIRAGDISIYRENPHTAIEISYDSITFSGITNSSTKTAKIWYDPTTDTIKCNKKILMGQSS